MTTDQSLARFNMIEGQIRPNKVVAPDVLARFDIVPRDAFVPEERRGVAYADEDVPLGQGRFLPEPMVQARMIQALDLAETDQVLDVGCATGYSSAILAGLAASVVATDPDAAFTSHATANLARLHLVNVTVMTAPVAAGAPQYAPFDAILVNGAVTDVPPALVSQLRDGGRLVVIRAVTDGFASVGRIWRYEKRKDILEGHSLMDVSCRYLPGCSPQPGFVF